MKTTVDLPPDLIKEIKLLAVEEGKNLKDILAELLRRGLQVASVGEGTVVKAEKELLKRRKALTQKFVAGEWGFELSGYEAAKEADRRLSAKRSRAWRV